MYAIIKSIEEMGRIFLMDECLLYTNIKISRTPVMWNGIFTYCINKGYSPFKSGLISGYFIGDNPCIARSVRGGISGVSVGITNKLSQYIINRIQK
ncbi:hypothetical protein NEPAR06_0531 [Nematocida parisii]|uniref:Uncharacterized protein n=1 Tax=Nematocida parisii (strain ERTm3) TaxID=935791 RepID=I3EIA1_NEMP3|nr:uncharacterized protein NEPG_01840 [Nematocida parisii ERTm1]EIJ88948.1 hypothetical protein NEQG_00767 [Nematocida parisii ERTm3]KAI5126257.1 hypothetical protein NEPAR08_0328 [Nematocida parisii]EIJ93498.1 hypothetical protein NEPG_01840 [Nematocida parisii ERTm1]KAI5127124.1 hypothetical protein NEPAR03_0791 [Nematocida parisii]KAI5140031.1 hypothetical protein NEPAR04_0005 [Nematocida parisii]|eukprot:XP_013059668.1 hypothetical protein NEPG_01840 [Nematocida parisii ERTm1]